MIKDKKGFTLVELIAVIGIIALLMALSAVALINIRTNVLNNDYKNLKSYLETRAAKYASDTNIKTVNVEELIKAGYVQPDDNTDIYNPITNKSMNCIVITSKEDGKGNYTSTLGEDLGKENGKCVTYQNTGDLEICLFDSTDNTCKAFDDNTWFNQDIELSVRYKNGKEIENDALIEWDSNNGYHNDGKVIKITTDAVITSNYHVKVTLDKKVGEAKKAVKVDKKNPVIRNIKVDSGWAKEKMVVVDASDTGSGVKGYALISIDKSCSNNASEYQASNTFKVNKAGTYKACVVDKANNYSDDYQSTNNIVEVSNIDNSVPKVPVITASDGILSDKWHTEKTFSLTFSESDNISTGMSPVKYYYGFSKNNANVAGSKIENIDEANYHQKTIYVRACNEAGSCSEFNEYKIKMDSTPPTYTSGGTIASGGTVTKPTYTDNSSGSGSVVVYMCVSTSEITSTDNSCFKADLTKTSVSCGSTYQLYSYAVDGAGNKTDVHKHTNTGGSYYTRCSNSVSSSRTSRCDATCQMKSNSNAWNNLQSQKTSIQNNSNLSQSQKNAAISSINNMQNALHTANQNLAKGNSACGGSCSFNSGTGLWSNSSGNTLYTPSNGNSKSTGVGTTYNKK